MSATRVFVRLFDGGAGRETDDEVVALPPPPLAWPAVIAAMAAAVGRDAGASTSGSKARLFLLPGEADGIAAELNARALRFGVRENDHFVLCLNGEDYQQPAASSAASIVDVEKPRSEVAAGSKAPPGGSMGGLSLGKKGNKRYRSISGELLL